ncbi:MAG: NAD(P)H-hydrate dehydratase [Alkalinema sp. RL_2_19]|nr:NAD(P)H-hydrate dehydratase [Alkalinema sp. RL_2_19]
MSRRSLINRTVVTTAQMQAIEARIFAAGMPVAALMEKVANRIAAVIRSRYPVADYPQVGVLVGPGHNGGDALVVARELYFSGYAVRVWVPCDRLKALTQQHLAYLRSLGIPIHQALPVSDCDVWLDGLFGFGLSRDVTGDVALLIEAVNGTGAPIVSIDLPSGIQTDTGQVLGTAIRATDTLCLGLWKAAFLQEDALPYLGESTLVDFDIPAADITAVLGNMPLVQRVDPAWALASLPRSRPPTTHKYQMGNLLLVCGSDRYAGAAILAGLGARASGVGMVTIAVPASLKSLLHAQLPEALIIPCPETATGTIQSLPSELDLSQYSTIGCGCGLTQEPQAVIELILGSRMPVVLDADGLNMAATHPSWLQRSATTVLTPHLGEFRRLFPAIDLTDRLVAVRAAAAQSDTILLLKGARVAIGHRSGQVRVNPASTPALARGGSGDVLTGLLAGLMAQVSMTAPSENDLLDTVQAAAWWHAQAGRRLVGDRTELGVDAHTLAHSLNLALQSWLDDCCLLDDCCSLDDF